MRRLDLPAGSAIRLTATARPEIGVHRRIRVHAADSITSTASPAYPSWFRSPAVSKAEVRAEIWRLGTRHLGWPLEGALDELKAPDLPTSRARLLRACVRKLQGR
jgi:hypothetical protein